MADNILYDLYWYKAKQKQIKKVLYQIGGILLVIYEKKKHTRYWHYYYEGFADWVKCRIDFNIGQAYLFIDLVRYKCLLKNAHNLSEAKNILSANKKRFKLCNDYIDQKIKSVEEKYSFPLTTDIETAKCVNELYGQYKTLKSELKKDIKNERQDREYKGEANLLSGEALLQQRYVEHLRRQGISLGREHYFRNGRVDIVTVEPNQIIELKDGSSRSKLWEAIGQLHYYSLYFPGFTQKIVTNHKISLSMRNILKRLNIEWEVFLCN